MLLSQQLLTQNPQGFTYIVDNNNFGNGWVVVIYDNIGGVKRRYYLGKDTTVNNVSFELTQRGCGAGKLAYNYIDIDFSINDLVSIFYKGVKIYTGYIDVVGKLTNKTLNLMPVVNKLKSIIYSKSFVFQTKVQMISDILTNNQSKTGIIYDVNRISGLDTNLYTYDWTVFKSPYKMLDEILKQDESNDTVYWGVDANNIFFVNTYLNYSTLRFDNQVQICESIKVNEDVSGVKATRYIVYKKDSVSNKNVQVGTKGVGFDASSPFYDANYPNLDIENYSGIKEDIYISDTKGASNTDILNEAYAELKRQAQTKLNIKVNNFNLEYCGLPDINDKLRVEDCLRRDVRTIIDNVYLNQDNDMIFNRGCWSGMSILSGSYVFYQIVDSNPMYVSYQFEKPILVKTLNNIIINCTSSNPSKVRVTVAYKIDNDSVLGQDVYPNAYGMCFYGYGRWGGDTNLVRDPKVITISASNIYESFLYNALPNNFSGSIQALVFKIEAIGIAPYTDFKIKKILFDDMYKSVYTERVKNISIQISEEVKCDLELASVENKYSSLLLDNRNDIDKIRRMGAI